MCQTFQESPEPQSNKLPPSSRPRKKTSIHQTLMNKLSAANEMAHAVAILDYQLQWVDKGVEVSGITIFSTSDVLSNVFASKSFRNVMQTAWTRGNQTKIVISYHWNLIVVRYIAQQLNSLLMFNFWNFSQYLTDNKDFSVVGVIGGQGVGKSTIASMLAGARPTGARRSYMFWPQSRDVRENGVNQTYGVYMAVSTERLVLNLNIYG